MGRGDDQGAGSTAGQVVSAEMTDLPPSADIAFTSKSTAEQRFYRTRLGTIIPVLVKCRIK